MAKRRTIKSQGAHVKRPKGEPPMHTQMEEQMPKKIVAPERLKPGEQPQKQQPHLRSFAERLANSAVFIKNHFYKDGYKYFKYQPDYRRVDRYFPYSEVGPLYMDLIEDHMFMKEREDEIKKKTEVMKELGLRYIVITPDMTKDINSAKERLHSA